MAIKLGKTPVRPTTIRLRYANTDYPAEATEWIDLQFAAGNLKHPSSGSALGDLEPRFLQKPSSDLHMRGRCNRR